MSFEFVSDFDIRISNLSKKQTIVFVIQYQVTFLVAAIVH
ncbi:hypothetical protein KsCSTR_30920 [Candidatus Kuenenia stuttgartiensis]|uniref:Uncharacterized protein n=1 Tax=Kuenenia stuttgartiensis TaxID=174633 RepID=A0A6G7GSP9_KUEST|nr:hypothetical protein KsCSTR_30920 [Candidatus Kuenenia stuttgartiensis]